MRIVLVVSLLVIPSLAEQWTASRFPNPRLNSGYKTCNMRSLSSVCDPDAVLTTGGRYRLNNELLQLGRRTAHSQGNFCQMKGIDANFAAVKSGNQRLANDLSKLWNIDGQCQKAVVFLLSADDRKLFYSGEESTGLSKTTFDDIVNSEQKQLSDGQFAPAIANIMKKIAASQKPTPGTNDNDGNDRTRPRDNGVSYKSLSFLMALLPLTLWSL